MSAKQQARPAGRGWARAVGFRSWEQHWRQVVTLRVCSVVAANLWVLFLVRDVGRS